MDGRLREHPWSYASQLAVRPRQIQRRADVGALLEDMEVDLPTVHTRRAIQ
jgi:hypothetical protein